jgi:protein-disulfide isomerase
MKTYSAASAALVCLVMSSIAASASTPTTAAAAPAVTTSTDMNTAGPVQQKQIETIVRDYIVKNPEVLIESLQNYQQKQMVEQEKKFVKIQQTSPGYANQLFHQSSDPVAGNSKGKVTIVEFFDYQCPHCIDMTLIIEQLIKSNPDVRVVLKEFPIRGPMSELATRAALAAQKQGKYFELHTALMNSKTEPLTENIIYDLAKSIGLNVSQLKTDMKSKSVDEQIETNVQLAKGLQIMFTPVFFIAKTSVTPDVKPEAIAFIPGQTTAAQLTDIVKKIGG